MSLAVDVQRNPCTENCEVCGQRITGRFLHYLHACALCDECLSEEIEADESEDA